MLKPIRQKKESKVIVKGFEKSKGNFKNQSINVNIKHMTFESICKLNEICCIPKVDENKRIVTKKAINTFDFILAILNSEHIEDLVLTSYRIGKKTVLMLDELIKKSKIDNLTLLISYNFPKFAPDVWGNLKTLTSTTIKLEDNHTKILLIKTRNNYYCIEGSGNLSINARIEQYSFTNNKEIYDFHYNWIKQI